MQHGRRPGHPLQVGLHQLGLPEAAQAVELGPREVAGVAVVGAVALGGEADLLTKFNKNPKSFELTHISF